MKFSISSALSIWNNKNKNWNVMWFRCWQALEYELRLLNIMYSPHMSNNKLNGKRIFGMQAILTHLLDNEFSTLPCNQSSGSRTIKSEIHANWPVDFRAFYFFFCIQQRQKFHLGDNGMNSSWLRLKSICAWIEVEIGVW